MNRPSVTIHRRATMSGARKAAILAQLDPWCDECGSRDGPYEIDHVIPLAMGGLDDVSNMQLLCGRASGRDCHARKTAHDVAAIAKAKRCALETCTAPPRIQLRSRGFGRTRSRGFDGIVRVRVQEGVS